MDYMLARYYGSSLGRFMAVDPAPPHPLNPQTFNRYIYAGNNPILYVDPDGLDFHLKCSGGSNCHKGRVGTWKTKVKKNGTVKRKFEKTRIREKGGKLVDQKGNVYKGSVDGKGVHFSTQQGGVTNTYTGVQIRNSAPVSFTQTSGALKDFSFTFSGNPHAGQDARGTWSFGGSQADFEAAMGAAGPQLEPGGRPGPDWLSDGGPKGDNATHMRPGDGTIHTGEHHKSHPAHIFEAGFNAIESVFGFGVGGDGDDE